MALAVCLVATLPLLGFALHPQSASAVDDDECHIVGPAALAGLSAWRVLCREGTRAWTASVVGVTDERRVLERRQGTWVIDPDDDGRVALIVRFRTDGGDVVAELFDDGNGDRSVDYRASGSDIVVTESPAPPVVLRAKGGWWTRGDLVNYDLDLTIDGLTAALMDPGTHTAVRTQSGERTDGHPDVTIQVRDPHGWGQPQFDVRQAYFSAPRTSAVFRTQLMVSERRETFGPLTGALLPYVADHRFGLVQPYGRRLPAIQIDWSAAKIVWVGEFVPSRGTGAGWFVYSVRRVDSRNDRADFENPFAFYDLAGARDGYPDLQIRNGYSLPEEIVGGAPVGHHVDNVRYSWDLAHDHTWDFKVDLLGRYAIEATVPLPSFSIRTVAYEDLPSWVVDHTWDAATFVAADERSYWTSEGIYEWSAGALLQPYLRGADVTRAARAAFGQIPEGMRGEYRVELGDRPFLYLSDVDGRLHLRGAEAGVFALPDDRGVRYESLGGEVIDRWIVTADGQERSSLSYLDDQLIFEDESGLRLKTVAPQRPPELLLPPTDSQQWTRLRQMITAARLGIPADDLAAHFARFAGTASSLPGASISEVSRQATGFRFALHLPSRAPTNGTVSPWAAGLQPGEYLVRYEPGMGYRVEPLLAAQPTVERVVVAEQPAQALEPVELRATIANVGGVTARDVPVTFTAHRSDAAGGRTVRAGTVRLDVPGSASAEARLTWSFPTGGEWIVTASPEEASAAAAQPGAAGASVNVAVQPAPSAAAWDLVRAQGRGGLFGLILAALLTGALLAAAAAGALPFVPRRRGRASAAAR